MIAGHEIDGLADLSCIQMHIHVYFVHIDFSFTEISPEEGLRGSKCIGVR